MFKTNLKFRNQRVEKFFLQLGFDNWVQQHKHFNYLGLNIVENIKLSKEDDWDMIIDKIVFGTQKLIQHMKFKRDLYVLNDTGDINISLGCPIPIKDIISENSMMFTKLQNRKKRKCYLQRWKGILSLFQNTIQSWKVRIENS